MLDLLIDRIVPVETGGDREVLTLPGLFSRLGRDAIDGFPGLAAHQAQAWYQFLAQLGALALLRGRLDESPEDPDVWRSLLADLTPDCADTAWSLMVEEPTSPAFLQPPTATIEKFKLAAETPDALDVLVTAKNHDRKRAQAIEGETASLALRLGHVADDTGIFRQGQSRNRPYERRTIQSCPGGPAAKPALGAEGCPGDAHAARAPQRDSAARE